MEFRCVWRPLLVILSIPVHPDVVHCQAAVATQKFRPQGTVAAKDSRKVGGRQVVLFEQEPEHFQWLAFGPLYPSLVVGFNEGTDGLKVIRLVHVEPVFKTQQRFDGLPNGRVISGVMQRARDITLAKAGVILGQDRKGIAAWEGLAGST